MNETDKKLVWEAYKSLSDGQNHFNDLENKYRTLAATWMLAYFAGIGFMLTLDPSRSVASREYIIIALSVLHSFGIWMLWNIDIRVYHRLLDSLFVEALQMERVHEWLPQVRTKMVFSQYVNVHHVKPEAGVMSRIRLFYASGIGVSLLIACGFLMASAVVQPSLQSLGVLIAFALASLLWVRYVLRHSTSPILSAWILREKPAAIVRLQRTFEAERLASK